MQRSLATLSGIRRLLLITLVGFVLWLGAYNSIVLGDAGDIVNGLLFALLLLAGDLIRAAQTLRKVVQTTSGLRVRMRGWRKPVAT